MYSLFHKLHLHTYLYIRERLTLWKPHFVNPSCKSTRGREPKRRKKLKKSQAPIITYTHTPGRAIILYEHIKTMYQYDYHLQYHTHTHTQSSLTYYFCMFWLIFLNLGGTACILYGIHISTLPIYIYYIQHKRHGTIASFCVKKPTENHCHGS